MKKLTLRVICGLSLSLGLCLSLLTAAHAAGGFPTPEISLSSSSIKADGSTKTTITVYAATFQCQEGGTTYFARSEAPCGSPIENPHQGLPAAITVSGSNNTIAGGSEGANGARYSSTGTDGKATFTLSSTKAESKTITATYYEDGAFFGPTTTATVTFTAVTQAAPPKPKTTTPAPTPTPEPTPPEAPKTDTLEVNGQTIASTEDITVQQGETFTLSGKTVPNGIVKLYIFSTPQEATVTADANGNWSYNVEGLEPGSHHIEAEVTDPATNKTSSRATLASFTIAEVQTPTTTDQPTPGKKSGWIWIIVAIVVFISIGAALWWWRKKHAKKSPTPPTNTPPVDHSASDDTPPNSTNSGEA
ncbi:MAG TPA: Ig-like domain-containing protein [Candidatus Saccharimonadales bacterium]|nr:Ig-like domain-containing protein [Candidatus Saccharimonadales bacterium]